MICRCRFPSTPKSFEPIGPTDTIMPAAACRPRTEAKNLHRTSRLDWRTPNTEQIIAVLREHEAGAKAGDLARKRGISEATLYNWKTKYGGMDVSDAKRLKALEDENAKLKKLLADQMLEASALRELLSKKW